MSQRNNLPTWDGHPQVMLPILFYNLGQQLASGAVNAAREPVD